MAKNLVFLVILVISSILPPTITAQDHKICPFESIYQFGDSISDVGNLIREGPVGARSYAARYPYGENFIDGATGRCSDGLLMIDYFAKALGLPLLKPYLERDGISFDHGVNFAVAGSTALSPSFFKERNIQVPSTDNHLNVQLDWFHSHLNSTCHTRTDCQNKLQRSLVFMGEIGGNDYNYGFFQNKPIKEIQSYVPHVVRAITDATRNVIRAGARRIIVPGNFPVGCFPIYLTSFSSQDLRGAYDDMGCLKHLNQFATYHNNYLKGALQELRREFPNVVILYGDYYKAFQSILRRSRSLGFKQASILKACCGIGGRYNYEGSRACGSPGVPVCSDPSRHIHWDGVHLTQVAYKHMANWLMNDLLTDKIQCVW